MFVDTKVVTAEELVKIFGAKNEGSVACLKGQKIWLSKCFDKKEYW